MILDDDIVPRCYHSTVVVVDISTFELVAFVLWGFGKDGFPLSSAQMILIDSQECKKVIHRFLV